MGSILLKNILLDGEAVDIRISGKYISEITKVSSCGENGASGNASGVEVVDCTGKRAFPGLVNMHTHAAMSLMRGIGEDILFKDWIARIWEVESDLDEEFVYCEI